MIWRGSYISHNISHPPWCQLAQVVPLASPPFNVKLSVWLPSSCNAAPLIAKATTQLKEVAFHQPIRQYQILCCFWVSNTGLLNEQRPRELVWMQRHQLGLCKMCIVTFLGNQPLNLSSSLRICILMSKYFVVPNELSVLFSTKTYIACLLLVRIKYFKWGIRVSLLLWCCTVWNNMYCWELMCYCANHLQTFVYWQMYEMFRLMLLWVNHIVV